MKLLAFFAFVYCCFTSINVFGQTPKAIEDDLFQSYKMIENWSESRDNHRYVYDIQRKANDSLDKANTLFGKKLKYYTGKYPFTITQKFSSFAQNPDSITKDKVQIVTSVDGNFRIYSWDVRSDGSEYGFDNVIQYRVGNKTISMYIDDPVFNGEHLYVYYYDKLYTLKAGNKTYYLALYSGAYTHIEVGKGLQVFDIENGKLNNDVKIIRTPTGMHSQLYYEFLFEGTKYEDINYDVDSKTISIPVILKDTATKKRIIYKFTGQYFEGVKN